MTMVERVARALCRSYWQPHIKGADLESQIDGEWTGWVGHARAAIEAMKGVSVELTDAGLAVPESPLGSGGTLALRWQAMIVAALEGEG